MRAACRPHQLLTRAMTSFTHTFPGHSHTHCYGLHCLLLARNTWRWDGTDTPQGVLILRSLATQGRPQGASPLQLTARDVALREAHCQERSADQQCPTRAVVPCRARTGPSWHTAGLPQLTPRPLPRQHRHTPHSTQAWQPCPTATVTRTHLPRVHVGPASGNGQCFVIIWGGWSYKGGGGVHCNGGAGELP